MRSSIPAATVSGWITWNNAGRWYPGLASCRYQCRLLQCPLFCCRHPLRPMRYSGRSCSMYCVNSKPSHHVLWQEHKADAMHPVNIMWWMFFAEADFCITLGGDGTVLHLTSLFVADEPLPPVVAFAMGTLGERLLLAHSWSLKLAPSLHRMSTPCGCPLLSRPRAL